MTATVLDAPSAPTALSSDELRAIGRVAGAVLPPELLDGWHRDDCAVADTVAVRSLLARGVLQLRTGSAEPALALTGAARTALGALLEARAMAGVAVLDRFGQERRQLVAECGSGRTLLLTEREPDVWTVETSQEPAEQVVAGVVADLLDGSPRPAPTGAGFDAPEEVLAQVDRFVAQGRTDLAAGALYWTGVPAAAADRWAGALERRESSCVVRLTRRVADGVFAGGAVRWVDGGAAGVWLVEPADMPQGDPADPDAGGWRRLSDAGVAGVRSALAVLLDGRLP